MSDAQFLSNITHLILGEVHERREEIDFLFVYIKHFLRVGLKIDDEPSEMYGPILDTITGNSFENFRR